MEMLVNTTEIDELHPNSSFSSGAPSLEDESEIKKPSRKQKLLSKVSIRYDKKKQKVIDKRRENLISMADYCNKQEEFKLWMYEEKHKAVSLLSANDQKTAFKKFIKLWNKRKLPQKYTCGRLTAPSSRRDREIHLIEDTRVIHTPDLFDTRGSVDLSFAVTPDTPVSAMSTFGKKTGKDFCGNLTPRRIPLSDVTFGLSNDSAADHEHFKLTSQHERLNGLRKAIFDNMQITSPINKFDRQLQQNREAAVISDKITHWKDLNVKATNSDEYSEDHVGYKDISDEDEKVSEIALEELDFSPYSAMKVGCKREAAVELFDQSHSPYARPRLADDSVTEGSIVDAVDTAFKRFSDEMSSEVLCEETCLELPDKEKDLRKYLTEEHNSLEGAFHSEAISGIDSLTAYENIEVNVGDKQDTEVIGGDKQDTEVIGSDKQDTEVIGEDKQDTEVIGGDKQDIEVIGGDKQDIEVIGGDNQDTEVIGGDKQDTEVIGGNCILKSLEDADVKRVMNPETRCENNSGLLAQNNSPFQNNTPQDAGVHVAKDNDECKLASDENINLANVETLKDQDQGIDDISVSHFGSLSRSSPEFQFARATYI